MLICHFISGRDYVRLVVCDDQSPIAYKPLNRHRIPLHQLETFAIPIAPPPGPLGPRPVALSIPLLEGWLPEEEWKQWRGAGHVQSGRTALLERIEREIVELESDPEFSTNLIDPENL